jgi:hypothetical protein
MGTVEGGWRQAPEAKSDDASCTLCEPFVSGV